MRIYNEDPKQVSGSGSGSVCQQVGRMYSVWIWRSPYRPADDRGVVFRLYTELFGLLDRRAWPSQTERSRWYSVDPNLTERPVNPLAGN